MYKVWGRDVLLEELVPPGAYNGTVVLRGDIMGKIWELDFYSRPILDDNEKKLWEVLICESPTTVDAKLDTLFRYSEFCNNNQVNSITLAKAISKAIEESGETPSKIRFFRKQMNNMIKKGCEAVGIPAVASRRTYFLQQWLAERMTNFYPQQAGYDETASTTEKIQYLPTTPTGLPDALRGDKNDKWALVTLQAGELREMGEWDIAFGEAFPLEMASLSDDMKIPGLLIFSSRALPLAAWMSGLELAYLRLEKEKTNPPCLCLETGASDSWILASITDNNTLQEALGFETVKRQANGVHFLAIQSSPSSQSFAAFWLLLEQG